MVDGAGAAEATVATITAIVTGTVSAVTFFGLFILVGCSIENWTRTQSPETNDNDLLQALAKVLVIIAFHQRTNLYSQGSITLGTP